MCKLFFFYRVLSCATFILVYGMSVALPFACYFQINYWCIWMHFLSPTNKVYQRNKSITSYDTYFNGVVD